MFLSHFLWPLYLYRWYFVLMFIVHRELKQWDFINNADPSKLSTLKFGCYYFLCLSFFWGWGVGVGLVSCLNNGFLLWPASCLFYLRHFQFYHFLHAFHPRCSLWSVWKFRCSTSWLLHRSSSPGVYALPPLPLPSVEICPFLFRCSSHAF